MIRMVLCGGKCGERGILSTKMVESLPLRQHPQHVIARSSETTKQSQIPVIPDDK